MNESGGIESLTQSASRNDQHFATSLSADGDHDEHDTTV